MKPIGSWKDMTETAELRASDGQGQDLFGDSISISGNTVAIGAEQMARGSEKRTSSLCLRVAGPI